jgi:hypothetical protein
VRDGSIAWTVRDAVVDLKIAAATGDGLKEHFLARKHGTGLALSSDHLDGLVAELDSLRSFGELQGCLAAFAPSQIEVHPACLSAAVAPRIAQNATAHISNSHQDRMSSAHPWPVRKRILGKRFKRVAGAVRELQHGF